MCASVVWQQHSKATTSTQPLDRAQNYCDLGWPTNTVINCRQCINNWEIQTLKICSYNSSFKDPRFSGRPKALQKVMSALFASSSVGGPNEEKNGGIVFRYWSTIEVLCKWWRKIVKF